KKIGKELFRSTEVAEQWFPVSINDNSRPYGEQTSHKIKVEMFSPWKGNSLYPYFDSSGDMLAFSRKYMTKVDIDGANKEVEVFETYTSSYIYGWIKRNDSWEEWYKPKENPIEAIPVVYATQTDTEWG